MRSRAIGLVAVSALVCAGTALATTDALRGNRQGMKVAERVMHAFAQIPGYRFSESHFFQIVTKGGKKPSLKYAFGFGTLQAGWTWASENGAMGLSKNQVVWWRDDLTPASSKHGQAVEIVFKGANGYWAFGNAAHHSCFRALNSASEMPNDHGFVITGTVSAPKGNTLSYTYRWGNGQGEAKETDVIDGSSHLVTTGHVSIGAYSFSFSNRFGGVPGAPSVSNTCK
jgi:hypothetical protein